MWFRPSDASLQWDHEIPPPALSEDTILFGGSYVKPTGNFVECQSQRSSFIWARGSLWAEGCCVDQPGPEVSFLFHLTPMWKPCFPQPPSLVFYLSFSLALKTKVQRTNIPWLVSEMLHPASGHWSPLPILLRATAGKHEPMETVRTPEIFSKPVC